MNAIPTTVLLTFLLLLFTIPCCEATTISITDETVEPVCVDTLEGVSDLPTPFLIYGHVHYKNGTMCNNSLLNITNLNTSAEWQAETSADSNYYQITLTSGIDLNATEVLQFSVKDGVYSSVTKHTVTADEVDDGGLFGFDLTLGPVPGDVNGDGHLTTADAVIVLQMAVRGEYSEVADVSGDRAVTSLDALMILYRCWS
jgi:hypothetical protein